MCQWSAYCQCCHINKGCDIHNDDPQRIITWLCSSLAGILVILPTTPLFWFDHAALIALSCPWPAVDLLLVPGPRALAVCCSSRLGWMQRNTLITFFFVWLYVINKDYCSSKWSGQRQPPSPHPGCHYYWSRHCKKNSLIAFCLFCTEQTISTAQCQPNTPPSTAVEQGQNHQKHWKGSTSRGNSGSLNPRAIFACLILLSPGQDSYAESISIHRLSVIRVKWDVCTEPTGYWKTAPILATVCGKRYRSIHCRTTRLQSSSSCPHSSLLRRLICVCFKRILFRYQLCKITNTSTLKHCLQIHSCPL